MSDTVLLSSLKLNDRNPRRIKDPVLDRLVRSIERDPEFMRLRPIVVDDAGMVLGGNQRLKACRKLGMKEVPAAWVVKAEDLTEEQRKRFILVDNAPEGMAGEWDIELAKEDWTLPELEELGFDLSDFGQPLNTGLTDPDDVPEPPADPTTKPGDLWLLGNHRLLCGDSTKAEDVERLMAGEKAEMMFTDPPYGVNYEGGHFHSGDVKIKRKREKLADDDTTAIYPAFLPVALTAVNGPCYMWFADSKARDVYNAVHDNGCEVHALIIWHKTNATYAAMNAQYKQRHEPCLYFKPRGSTLRWCGETTEATVWSQDRDGINEFHPTQKPVSLAAKAIGNHEAANVLDMFCGSGTTLIAAEQLGRKCYGMEISPAYCDVIVKRWEQFTGEKATLA